MTKKQLKAYRDITEEIEQIKGQLATICDPTTAKANALPGGSGGVSDPTGNRALLLDKLEKQYTEKLEELTAAQLAIEEAIETLEPRERRLVRLYYIDGLTWEQVCVEMCYSWRQVHRIHAGALEKLRGVGT